MQQRSILSPSRLTRRTAIGSTGVIAAVLGLGSHIGRTSAQEATPRTLTCSSAEGQTTAINGVELYYEEHGPADGQPVLLLHGGAGNTESWVNLTPVLVAAGYRVIAMDSRRHGRSGWGEEPLSYELMAADALGLLDLLEIAKTDVVGWSDGAILGLELAIHHPQRLNRVVAYGANFTPDGVHELVPSDQLPPFERLGADYQRLSPQPERFEDLFAELQALYEVAPNFSESELHGITTPILILDGAEEEFITPEHTRRLAALIPGAELVIMPGTGHFAPFAKPAVFDQIVLDFLQGNHVERIEDVMRRETAAARSRGAQ